MRLLNSNTLTQKEFFDSQVPDYAILSHTWGEEEITFNDIHDVDKASNMKGFAKVKNCCAQASKDGFQWVWIDTCCIDKTSSAELSEAINSMFRWYQRSRTCYAYLADVTYQHDQSDGRFFNEFARSRWFTRGWMLQELIAPSTVEFYSADWTAIGNKLDLHESISKITGIDVGVLRGDGLSARSVAERMSWAAKRTTTRSEDMAYSLIGVFGVNMPMLYGEGGTRAFIRLQEAILKLVEDYSIFAWADQGSGGSMYRGLLADSPEEFRCPAELSEASWQYSDLDVGLTEIPDSLLNISSQQVTAMQMFDNPLDVPPSVTNKGLRVSLAMRKEDDDAHLAYLHCRRRSDKNLLCIYMTRPTMQRPYHFARRDSHRLIFIPPAEARDFKIVHMYVKQPGYNFGG